MPTQEIKNQEWETIPFEECLQKVKVGKNKQVMQKDYLKSGKYPIVDQGQSFIAGYTDDGKKVISDIQPFIIFGDHTRILKYIDFSIALGADGTKIIKPNKDFDAKFFFYFLKDLNVPSKGYNRHYSILKEKNVLHPEIYEQKSIARTLSTVQEAIEGQEKLIGKLKDLKRSMMNHLFTHGTINEPTKITEIGEIPESWEVVELGKICEIIGSSITFKQAENKKGETEVHGIKVSDMNLVGNEKFILNAQTNFKFSDTSKLVPPNAIIFPKRGAAIATNKKRITTKYSLLDPNVIAVVPSDKLLSGFIYYYFETFDLSSLTDKGTIPQLNKKDLLPVILPLPPKEEQIKIDASLDIIGQKIESAQQKLSNQQNLFKTLLHELMSGERRVR